MQSESQISAYISAATKARLERYAQAHGMKKGAIIEAALLHHLQALDELPVDVVIPARLVVSADDLARIADETEQPPPPTPALRALVAGEPVDAPPQW